MNKRLKEILKEYEERKHKIIKGDESMNIVVLAGGTSTCLLYTSPSPRDTR